MAHSILQVRNKYINLSQVQYFIGKKKKKKCHDEEFEHIIERLLIIFVLNSMIESFTGHFFYKNGKFVT